MIYRLLGLRQQTGKRTEGGKDRCTERWGPVTRALLGTRRSDFPGRTWSLVILLAGVVVGLLAL